MSQRLRKIDRRTLMKLLGIGGGIAFPLSAGPWSPLSRLMSTSATAAGASPHRFLQIFLKGGWDSGLTTDPAIAGKANYAKYDGRYHDSGHPEYFGDPTLVGGGVNPALMIGGGMSFGFGEATPINPFLNIPTTIVNGMFVDVTAHELAQSYMLTGSLSLSRGSTDAAILTKLGQKSEGFPSALVLGGGMPLGKLAEDNPPMHAVTTGILEKILAGPKTKDNPSDIVLTDGAIDLAEDLISQFNDDFKKALSKNEMQSLEAWAYNESYMQSFYAQDYHSKMEITSLMGPYNFATDFASESMFAAAFRALEHNLTNYISISYGDFDTHSDHVATQVPLIQRLTQVLDVLVKDMLATADTHPAASPGDTLADNTTILITSEFNRTPQFNGDDGTDHWKTGSAILMGRGVKANTVFGKTNDDGKAMDPAGTIVIEDEEDKSSALLPDHLAAAILRHFGLDQEADDVETEDISDDIFQS